jgi:inner membrane protein
VDNITHSLVGLASGELAFQCASHRVLKKTQSFRFALWVMALATNNLPDLDFLYAWITEGKLGYLLHHRGHTHTFLVGFVQSGLALFVFMYYSVWRKKIWTRKQWKWFAIVAVSGPILHILLDAVNIYGVHPFWPIDNRWIYGDFLFIVEPWAWCILGAALAYSGVNRILKWTFLGIAALSLILSAISGLVPVSFIVAMAVTTVLLVLGFQRIGPEWPVRVGTCMLFLVLSVFFAISRYAKLQIRDAAADMGMSGRLLDIAVTPLPANFLCWRAFLVEQTGTEVIYYRAAYTPVGQPYHWCPIPPDRDGTFEMSPVITGLQPPSPVYWEKKGGIPLEVFGKLSRDSCEFRSFLRFSRIPFLQKTPFGIVMGDLRFDREEGIGFAELLLSESTACPSNVPFWKPPRADLFTDY